jgi:hypothetical protein
MIICAVASYYLIGPPFLQSTWLSAGLHCAHWHFSDYALPIVIGSAQPQTFLETGWLRDCAFFGRSSVKILAFNLKPAQYELTARDKAFISGFTLLSYPSQLGLPFPRYFSHLSGAGSLPI